MKRIFYSMGFFLVLFFLTCGFFFSYQIVTLRDRMSSLEQETALVGKQVSANPFSRDSDYIFETLDPETGKLIKSCYRITSYAGDKIVLRQEDNLSDNLKYRLVVEGDSLVVYKEESNEVFEYTNITLEALPSAIQAEVLAGKEIVGTDALYSFLENYSS